MPTTQPTTEPETEPKIETTTAETTTPETIVYSGDSYTPTNNNITIKRRILNKYDEYIKYE